MWLCLSGGAICTVWGLGYKFSAHGKKRRRDAITTTPGIGIFGEKQENGVYCFDASLTGNSIIAPISQRECIRYRLNTKEVLREYDWRSGRRNEKEGWKTRTKRSDLSKMDSGQEICALLNPSKQSIVLSDEFVNDLFSSKQSCFEAKQGVTHRIVDLNINTTTPRAPSSSTTSSVIPVPPPPEIMGYDREESIIQKDKSVFCRGYVKCLDNRPDNGLSLTKPANNGKDCFCEYGTKTSVLESLNSSIEYSSTYADALLYLGSGLVISAMISAVLPSSPSGGALGGNVGAKGRALPQ